MKTLKCLIVGMMTISSLAQAQETKIHLRDFTPRYTIDTLLIEGNASYLKRRVIAIQQTEAVRSAYWDADTKILTVQYNSKLVQFSAIKNFFFNNQPLVISMDKQKPNRIAFVYYSGNQSSLTSKNKK